jgi:hypothetical protein
MYAQPDILSENMRVTSHCQHNNTGLDSKVQADEGFSLLCINNETSLIFTS